MPSSRQRRNTMLDASVLSSVDSASNRIVVEFVARYSAAWKQPNVSNVRALMHADTQNLIPPMTQPGNRDSVLAHFEGVLKKVPDLSLITKRWAHSGDTVTIEWSATATVNGRPLAWSGIDIIRLRGDKIIDLQSYWDTQRLNADVQAARV
ncbi:MAG: nuclear transport factor 2 family protein [Undibacterium sp.]|nr:nuclear transport factor 2 family protein [Undibacterium sp.]